MSTAPRVSPEWLALREDADADARAEEPLAPLAAHLAGTGRPLTVHDLGCGTGSLARWLAPRLPGPQHWVLHDHDPRLLACAEANMPATAADGTPVTAETSEGDLARLSAADFAGASLVAASALLDLLTRTEVERVAAATTEAGCAALLTLSVVGRVQAAPAHPLDVEIAAAFNAHQRRTANGRGPLLGPDAATVTAEEFERRGARVRSAPSPWRLGPDRADLTAEWLRGWVGAACEQRPELAPRAETYLDHRLGACTAGELRVAVHHTDLLALPAQPEGTPP